jgi:hypothetical protein
MSENSFSLIVALPGEEPVAHELQGDAITFGRSPENQIQVLVAEVSVRHGQFLGEGGGYRLVDPGSTNGTRVNGQPVGPEGVVLNPMDRLLLGTLVPAYFVPSSMLAANAPSQLIATIEASAPPARVKTAPVAAPAAAAPGVRAAVPLAPPSPAAPGGPATVKLDQVRAPGPGVRPAPVPTAPRLPATPAAGAPAPGAPVPAPLRPPGVAPVAPPKAPGIPAPARPAALPAAAVPVKPAAGVIPVKPISGASTVPIKRVAPSAPTIPLPKKPGE